MIIYLFIFNILKLFKKYILY